MMKKLSEGKKMFISVIVIFLVYAVVFFLFKDYEQNMLPPLEDDFDWPLLYFSILVMTVLVVILYGYAKRMDRRINNEQAEKELEVRRQLTQNISHELKTPVASILGYMDTILENPDITEEMRTQFISRSRLQAQRLTSLLQDLSILNGLDYASDIFKKEAVNLSKIISEVVAATSYALQQKNMTINLQLPEEKEIFVLGDPSLLYSIFHNLIDNAIKYAGENTCISLLARESEDFWHFSLSDNGIGLPEEHLPRIFERFYRVDKGRSRQMGGTGLGLAIVKHAVQFHEGDIAISHNADGGLRFDFSLIKRN